jgi:hypothetical protein
MGPDDDRKWKELLREWQVPDAPASLDAQVLGPRRNWWSFLWTGSIRIPVPVGIALAAIVLAMAVALLQQRPAPSPAPSPTVSLVEFRPVNDLNVRVIRNHESN